MRQYLSLISSKLTTHLYLLLFSSIAFFTMLREIGVAKDLLKLNLLAACPVLLWQLCKKRNYDLIKSVLMIALLPASLILLSYLATGEYRYKSYTKTFILSYGLVLTTAVLYQSISKSIGKISPYYIKATLALYTLTQLYMLLIKASPYGSTVNPHFLALYSSICLILSSYYFASTKTNIRYTYLVNALILGAIILYTSSRPTWIGLALSSILLLHHYSAKGKLKLMLAFLGVQLLLVTSNLFNYKLRLLELVQTLSTEERTILWADTWKMQLNSQPLEWLYGHGISSFYQDFQQYSSYHLTHEFWSPHNLFLDILYRSGFLGVLITGTMYYLIYRYWGSLRQKRLELSKVGTCVLALLTTSTFITGINYSFYSVLNTYTLAFIICAQYIYTQHIKKQLSIDHEYTN